MPAATRPVAGSTPASLKRLIVMLLAGTVLLWLTATTLQRSLQSTAESVRGSASPAYLDAVQAHAALSRADIVLGAGSKGELGFAYLTYASSALRDPQGGLLASIDQLAGPDQQALRGQLASTWADPVLLVAFAVPALLALAGIVVAQAFLRRRFRRAVSLPLLLAALLACGLSAWMAIATLHADAAFAAAKTTALPRVTV